MTSRRPCVICGGDMPRRVSSLQKTCSAKCGYESRKRMLRPPRTCPVCATTLFPVRHRGMWMKHCSRRCYHRAVGVRPAMLSVNCWECGGAFVRTAAALKRVARSFCSKSCQTAHIRGDAHYAWRGNKDPNRGSEWNKIAAAIRRRDHYCCRRCGLTQAENGEKLAVDHVRPWRTFTDKALANHPDNLAALCKRCHSKKTTTVERRWLKGDVVSWKRWVASLNLPSAKFGWVA